jgi:ABC-type arginine transport system permease subunit
VNVSDDLKITVTVTAPLLMLCRYRRSKNLNQTYYALEVAVDGLLTSLFLGIYIAGIVILAVVRVGDWHNMYSYKIARGIPQIYSNLSVFLLL